MPRKIQYHWPQRSLSFSTNPILSDVDRVFQSPLHTPLHLPILPESRGASPHNLALTDEFRVELAAVEGEEDVKVDAYAKQSRLAFQVPANLTKSKGGEKVRG